ncbi:MAG: ArnT family glycosyltransferase [Cyanobacteriota bacterium]
MNPPLSPWETYLERRPRSYALISVLWLGFLAAVAFFLHLGTLGLTDKTESLFVEVAREMWQTGDWVTPRWNGEVFFDYPVGGYWLVALSFTLLGVNEVAARLPVALLALASVLGGFWVLKDYGLGRGEAELPKPRRWLRAWLGAGILALNPAWLAWGRTSVTDMFLASAITLCLLSFFRGYVQKSKFFYYLSPVWAGAAVLAKGPVGVLLPGLIILCFLLYRGEFWAVWREANVGVMALIFFLVAAPWYILATQANGMAFLYGFIGFSNFERFTSVLYRHAGPWWFYLPWCLILLLPWSSFLPLAVAQVQPWRRGDWRRAPRSEQLGPFCCLWFFLILLFFSSAATKLPGYILPLVPGGALLIALYWGQVWNGAFPRWRWGFWLSAGINLLLLTALSAAAFLSPSLLENEPELAAALQGLALPVILGGILALTALAFLTLLILPQGRRWLWGPNLGFWLGTLMFVIPPLGAVMDRWEQKPFREISQLTGQAAQPGEPVWVMGYRRYSLLFYSGKTAVFLDDVPYGWELIQPGRDNNASPTVLITGDREVMERFNLRPGDYQLLGERGSFPLWRVSKETLRRRQP